MKPVFLGTKKPQKNRGTLYKKLLIATGFKLGVNQALKSAVRQTHEMVCLDDLASATNTTLRTKWPLAIVKGKILSEQG